LLAAQSLADRVGDRADALHTLALSAQLVVVNHLGQAENA
jgi:hypothetical protein